MWLGLTAIAETPISAIPEQEDAEEGDTNDGGVLTQAGAHKAVNRVFNTYRAPDRRARQIEEQERERVLEVDRTARSLRLSGVIAAALLALEDDYS